MRETVLSVIKRQALFSEGETVVLGLSGGADSLALLVVLSELRETLGIKLVAVHFNHCIRGEEALRDAKFSEKAAKGLGVEFVLESGDVPAYARERGMSLEEAGRALRYKALADTARMHGARKIAVAHHADDQVETILFNLVRGSSLEGLCGMDYKGQLLGYEDLEIIRPLLGVSREAIEKYLCEKGISEWCTDSTNLSEDYSRNQLRGQVIPKLSEINSGARPHILSLAADLREASDYIAQIAEGEFLKRYSDGRLDVSEYAMVPAVVWKRVLYTYICTICGKKKDIERQHVDKLLSFLDAQSGKCMDLPYGVRIKKQYDTLVKLSAEESSEGAVSVISLEALKSSGECVLDGLSLRVIKKPADYVPKRDKSVIAFDYDRLFAKTRELELKRPAEGDYFCPFTDGRRKSVTRFFIDEKVLNREEVRVLGFDKHVIYIEGYRNDETFRVSEATEYVLEIRRL